MRLPDPLWQFLNVPSWRTGTERKRKETNQSRLFYPVSSWDWSNNCKNPELRCEIKTEFFCRNRVDMKFSKALELAGWTETVGFRRRRLDENRMWRGGRMKTAWGKEEWRSIYSWIVFSLLTDFMCRTTSFNRKLGSVWYVGEERKGNNNKNSLFFLG